MKTMQIPTLFRFSALAVALALATPAIAHPATQNQRDPDAAQHRDDRAAHADRAHPARNDQHAVSERARDAVQAQQREVAQQQAARQQEQQQQRQRAAAEQARQAQQRQAVDQQRRAQAQRRDAMQRAASQQRAEAQRHAADQRREDAQQREAQQRQAAQREAMQRRAAGEHREDMQRRAVDQREDALRARQRADADAQQRARQRISDAEHRQRIADQQRRLTEYRNLVSRHEALERQQFQVLQQARRMQAWRYQQAYWAGVRSQQARWATRGQNYASDPYYWTPASYRYVRSGRNYMVNQYAADLLQQAVRYGYDQGVRAGEADRGDRWGGGYNNNFAFQDALYGYNGYYVSPEDYSYYFRQGFQRGYQDGYNSAWQYGRYDNGSYNLLSSVLQMILNLQPLG